MKPIPLFMSSKGLVTMLVLASGEQVGNLLELLLLSSVVIVEGGSIQYADSGSGLTGLRWMVPLPRSSSIGGDLAISEFWLWF
jgi:hypothetical protein